MVSIHRTGEIPVHAKSSSESTKWKLDETPPVSPSAGEQNLNSALASRAPAFTSAFNPWLQQGGSSPPRATRRRKGSQPTTLRKPSFDPLLSQPSWEDTTVSDPICEDRTTKSNANSRELEVIVHEVSSDNCLEVIWRLTEAPDLKIKPSDSLAGVALMYGIHLSELRKANKLWASDTIHLRKVLYIPQHSRQFASRELVDLESNGNSTASTSSAASEAGGDSLDESGLSRGSGHTRSHSSPHSSVFGAARTLPRGADIRRIPVSQMSFFPPPTAPTPSFASETLPTRSSRPLRPTVIPRSSHETQSSSSRTPPRQPSLFGVFPTLDTVSRLSFESIRGTSPSLSPIGGSVDENEPEHVELDVVKRNGWRTSAPLSSPPMPRSDRTFREAVPVVAPHTPPKQRSAVEKKGQRRVTSQQPTPLPMMVVPPIPRVSGAPR